MSKYRKAKRRYVVQGHYHPLHGWEDVAVEETQTEARKQRETYDKNEPDYPHRIVSRWM